MPDTSGTPDANKAYTIEYLRQLEAGHYDTAFAMLADDAVVWISGRGSLSKTDFVALVRSFRSYVVGPMRLQVVGAIAEGDRVAVEVEGGAEMQGGGRYDNQYHFVFVLKDGRISVIKEYMNAAAARAAWMAVGAAQPGR